MEKKFKKNKGFILFFLVVIIFLITILVQYGKMKMGYHMDEIYTFGLSNSYYEPFPYHFGEWIPSSYYTDYLTVNEIDNFSMDSVRYNQSKDVHPPFFYVLFHIVSSFFPNIFSKWIGISINIVFYLFIFLTIYILMNYLIGNKKLSLVTSLFWGLSIGVISSVMYIRMYMMLTFFSVLFVYFAIRYLHKEGNYFSYLFFLFFTSLAGILTQYYFLIGAFFVSAILFLILLLKKEWTKLINFSTVMLLSILVAIVVFPPMISHLFDSNRGLEAINNAASSSSNFKIYLELINNNIFGGQFSSLIVIILCLILLNFFMINKKVEKGKAIGTERNKNFIIEMVALIVIPAILYVVVIQKIAPYQTARYIYSVFPLLIIGVVYLIYLLSASIFRNNCLINSLIIIIVSMTLVQGFLNEQVDYLYKDYQEINEIVQNYKNNDVFIIENAKWKITGNLVELKKFQNVYPYSVDPENFKLPEDERLSKKPNLVVYINNEFNQKEVVEQIQAKYGYNSFSKLYEQNDTTSYYFKKN